MTIVSAQRRRSTEAELLAAAPGSDDRRAAASGSTAMRYRIHSRSAGAGRAAARPCAPARSSLDAHARPLAAADRDPRRRRLGLGLRRAGDVRARSTARIRVGGETHPARRRHRLSRSQLGLLGRRVVAVGPGAARAACRSSTAASFRRPTPPTRAASPASSPLLGPDGPLGYATDVTHRRDERADPRQAEPHHHSRQQSIARPSARGRGRERHPHAMAQRSARPTTSTSCRCAADIGVTGKAGDRTLDFTAPGAAETFRGGPRDDGAIRAYFLTNFCVLRPPPPSET